YDQEEEGPIQFHADGIDSLEFFLSVNQGESLKPLSKTASGGELSRIMLAMKNVLTDRDSIPVQIFDEIDTGISGRAAQKVADKLWTLARGRQVLCVTHLSQLAAMADADYLIEKKEKGNRTATSIRMLGEEERMQEIARINVGSETTDLALSSAGQMLEACRARQKMLLAESEKQ
ncbi:MAG: DNA repair protein RecN, partial [Clostridia bacterium]|nr:DNA repair protein RecN [Clostridia bacterium]